MTHAILKTLFLIVLSLAGYIAAFRLYSRMSRPVRIAAWAISSATTTFWLLVHFSLFQIVSLVWLIRIMTFVPLEYSAPLVGVFAAMLQSRTNARNPPRDVFVRHNGAVLAVFLIIPFTIAPIVIPVKHKIYDEWKGEACIQTTGSTCAPACAATILRRHGIRVTEKEAAREVLCSELGTGMWHVGRYLRRKGLAVHVLPTGHRQENPPTPCIAGAGLGGKDGINHAIIILDISGDTFTLMDPLTGIFQWPREKVYENYYFYGFLIHVPDPE
ncbi:MAG TPA: cysteine peptidase family C39 domain-containing protein [Candidatus Sumerlaeota bacterium]|nr:cysteine peptidase family C39 domain-containing protein [Candidatus Sumerlaeota bacterium]